MDQTLLDIGKLCSLLTYSVTAVEEATRELSHPPLPVPRLVPESDVLTVPRR